MRSIRHISLISTWTALAAILGGCSHFEFDLTQPADLAVHIGSASPTRLSVPPMEYRLQASEGRLVMEIHNNGSDAVELLGARSTLVDPDKQSHPLVSQTIAPGSYIKLLLPPYPPNDNDTGPRIGIGFGARYGRAGLPAMREPMTLDVSPGETNVYWDWNGESDVKLTLVFAHADQSFSQAFTFHKRKM